MSTRRNFLKVAGVSLTASLLKSVNSSAAKLSVGNTSVKIGILLPRSTEHPQYPGSFQNGLRLGLNQRNALKRKKIELITEQVNYGSPIITKGKIQQLISENNVNMFVGLLNSEVAVDIGDLVKNAQAPILIANAGENYLTKKVKENPYLFFNTLNLFQNAYLSGKYAVEKFGKRIGVITALYDSGYDALFAFYKGVESAGGTIVETHLKKQDDNSFITRVLDRIEIEDLDGMYVFLNGNLADDFFRSLHAKKLQIPAIATSFATEDKRMMNLGAAANNLQNFSAWTKNLNNTENQKFVSAYKKQFFKDPDQFSFLGYESGLIIYESLANCKGDFSGMNLAAAISGIKIKSPGGEISVNNKSGLVANPVYLCTTKQSAFQFPENNVIEKTIPASEFHADFVSLETDLHSGWLNPYLFV